MRKRIVRKRRAKNLSNCTSTPNDIYGNCSNPGVEDSVQVRIIQYDDDAVNIIPINETDTIVDKINTEKKNWIDITGESDTVHIRNIFEQFGLRSFDVRDILSDTQINKVIQYKEETFLLLNVFHIDNTTSEIITTQIALIIGDCYVLSMQDAKCPIFDVIKTAIQTNEALVRKKSANFLLYMLLNVANSQTMNTIMYLEDRLSEIEDLLLSEIANSSDVLHFLHLCRTDYKHIKRSVTSFREEYSNLLQNTNGIIAKGDMAYFDHFDDRLRTTLDNLDALYDSLRSLLDLYYNNNNMRMNEIIKRLTLVSSIFIPLTFMAGVWGMNFRVMPELHTEYGYLLAWVTFVIVALICVYFLKKKKWF